MTRLTATALVVLAVSAMAVAARSDIEQTTDDFVPAHLNASEMDANYFASELLQKGVVPVPPAGEIGGIRVHANEFPALTGLGVSVTLLEFTPTSVHAPHLHPHGNELLYVLAGTLDVGFVNGSNKLFTKTLVAGDLFIFLQGNVHYQVNPEKTKSASALSVFSSSNPGSVKIPEAVFGSLIPKPVLAKAFGVTEAIIEGMETPHRRHT